MCSRPRVSAPQELPPPRALARAPQRIDMAARRTQTGALNQRRTVLNASGTAPTAPTANLGGTSVVLGG